jgi:hypothetical protein
MGGSILQDHLVNDLSTKEAPPAPEEFTDTVELFVNHYASTSMTPHSALPVKRLIGYSGSHCILET